jgi:hypothetical protein
MKYCKISICIRASNNSMMNKQTRIARIGGKEGAQGIPVLIKTCALLEMGLRYSGMGQHEVERLCILNHS